MGDGTERMEVSRPIAADAAEIFAIVSSPGGHVLDDAGEPERFEGIAGFAEESRSRW